MTAGPIAVSGAVAWGWAGKGSLCGEGSVEGRCIPCPWRPHLQGPPWRGPSCSPGPGPHASRSVHRTNPSCGSHACMGWCRDKSEVRPRGGGPACPEQNRRPTNSRQGWQRALWHTRHVPCFTRSPECDPKVHGQGWGCHHCLVPDLSRCP